jgi:hypothetical protein
MLLDAGMGLSVADWVALRFERSGALKVDQGFGLSGHVVRVVADPSRPARVQVGIAFDAPIPEDQLMARVSLSRAGARGPRGADR